MATTTEVFDDERQTVTAPNFRSERAPGVVRWCSIIESEIKIKYSVVPSGQTLQAVEREMEVARQRGCSLEWQVYSHDGSKELTEALVRTGFRPAEPASLMILNIEGTDLLEGERQARQQLESGAEGPGRHDSSRLRELYEVRRVCSVEQLVDYTKVLQAAWNGRDFTEHGTFVATYLQRWPEHVEIYVGYIDGEPVCCGRTLVHPGSKFAHLVGGATVPEKRRQGLYSDMVRERARVARARGLRFLSVEAQPMSRPILERLGFETVSQAIRWQMPESPTQ